MSPLWRGAATTLAAGIASFVTVSCSSDRVTSPPQLERPVYSIAGIPRSEGEMRARLDRVTRHVAVALSDAGVRAYVYQQLHASPDREHKLHFDSFAFRVGSPFSSALASAAALTPVGLRAQLDSLMDLEFYMPVKEHWARWTGGPDLLVAWAIRDHETPVAYDLRGSRVALTSAEEPPATPTLGIVPRETDFSQPTGGARPVGGDCGPDCATPLRPPPSGVVMTMSYIPGHYEGFLMGDPEFEVHALARKSATDTQLSDWQCAGEHAASAGSQPGVQSEDYVYDQNGASWTGQVLLLGKDQVNAAQAFDSSVVYTVWEDDNTPCRVVRAGSDVDAQINDASVALTDAANAIAAYLADNRTAVLVAWRLVRDVKDFFGALQNDDFVGFIVDASKAGVSHTDATHAIVRSVDGGLEVEGRAEVVAQP